MSFTLPASNWRTVPSRDFECGVAVEQQSTQFKVRLDRARPAEQLVFDLVEVRRVNLVKQRVGEILPTRWRAARSPRLDWAKVPVSSSTCAAVANSAMARSTSWAGTFWAAKTTTRNVAGCTLASSRSCTMSPRATPVMEVSLITARKVRARQDRLFEVREFARDLRAERARRATQRARRRILRAWGA